MSHGLAETFENAPSSSPAATIERVSCPEPIRRMSPNRSTASRQAAANSPRRSNPHQNVGHTVAASGSVSPDTDSGSPLRAAPSASAV